MRVLHVVHQYPPERLGGTEVYTQTLAQHQARQGHSVAVFCPSSTPAAEFIVPDREEGVRVYRAAIGARGSTEVFLGTYAHSALDNAFQIVLERERPELAHVQHLMGLPASLASRLRTRQIPFVVTLHDYWFVCANAQLLTNYSQQVCGGPRLWVNCGRCALARIGKPAWWWLAPGLAPGFAYRAWRLRRILELACWIIVPTDFVRDTYRRLGLAVDKFRVIPHGIAAPRLMPGAGPRVPDPHRLRIAYIGGLSWQKGVHILVEAVNGLPHDRVSLSVYGDTDAFPDYVASLKRQARHPGIVFAGRAPQAEVWDRLHETDVVVVPSLWYETASLVIQEAFAAGVPVIASDIGALRERVRAGIDGQLLPPGDPSALQDALRRFLDEPEWLDRMRAAIRPVRTMVDHVTDIDAVYASAVV